MKTCWRHDVEATGLAEAVQRERQLLERLAPLQLPFVASLVGSYRSREALQLLMRPALLGGELFGLVRR
jgi:hypothetical protein